MDITLESHAKINVFLSVPGRREDGFHSVKSWMLPISLSDSLKFETLEEEKIEIQSSDPTLPTDQSNLIRKAAELLKRRCTVPQGCRISLEKRIPIGAGLGGGSSNGSTTLLGLNQLWNLKLSEDDLEKLAAEFGSDTAFFIRRRSALSEGRGEILTWIPYPKSAPIFLMNFGFGSSTAWAYQNLKLKPGEKNPDSTLEFPSDPTAVSMASLLYNDLEKPVFRKFPLLKIARKFLGQHPSVEGAMMCGSGSTMMALLKSPELGKALQRDVQERFGKSVWMWSGTTLAS